MIIVTPEEMQRLDRLTIEELGIPGMVLMETAGRGVARWVDKEWRHLREEGAVVVCGPGNNGGDGFVAARWLRQWGWKVTLFLLVEPERFKGDAEANLRIVRRLGMDMVELTTSGLEPLRERLGRPGVVVDAIFGTGLSRPVEGRFAQAIELINGSGLPVVSVDIPSGISGYNGRPLGTAVKADLTVTMALPKTGHRLYPGREFTGRLEVWDISIPHPRDLGEEIARTLFDLEEARAVAKSRPPAGHKGTFGHLLCIGGSRGKAGAAALMAHGGLRSGCGLVTVAAPASVQEALAIKLTEAMTAPLPEEEGEFAPSSAQALSPLLHRKRSVALGPGMGTGPGALALVEWLAGNCTLPVVADADALNCLAGRLHLLQGASSPWVLTPHPGEMARLVGASVPEIKEDRMAAALHLARETGAVVVLKGAATVTAAPEGPLSINDSGNSGMATGGMGDVLTWIIGGLLAQGLAPYDAARLGVFVHGLSGDLLARLKGPMGYTAQELAQGLPRCWSMIHGGGHGG